MSTTEHPRFTYTALDFDTWEIRLLTLRYQPNETSTISCTLEHVDLATSPKYNALSYTWGDPESTKMIIVNGREFTIREDLYHFLHIKCGELDNVGESEPLWIDAVCINQDDDAERLHQVAQMADIYRSAAQVFIWLGLPFPGSDSVVNVFESPPEYLKETGGIYVEDLTPWKLFLDLSYWRRVWISQELILATSITVYLGWRSWPWTSMDYFARCYPLWTELIKDKLERLRFIQLYNARKDCKEKLSWYEAILLTSNCECEQVLDKAYGVLGLVRPESRIEADYTLSAPILYIKLCRKEAKCVLQGKRFRRNQAHELGALMYVLWDRLELWTPDWDNPEFAQSLKIELLEQWAGAGDSGWRYWNKTMIRLYLLYYRLSTRRLYPHNLPPMGWYVMNWPRNWKTEPSVVIA